VLAPAGTPRPIIDRLNQEITKALRSPEIRDRLIADGTDPAPTTPEEFAAYIKSETEKWTKVIKAAGIKPQ
jgi:tripartite-type tricarboxylate transporter receptor subunit TctC